jgi:hypothetical protein
MTKTYFHTYDIFDIKDEVKRKRYFDSCLKEALNCGLTYEYFMENSIIKLELWGSRLEFLRYYLKTLIKCQHKLNGIIRLASFL